MKKKKDNTFKLEELTPNASCACWQKKDYPDKGDEWFTFSVDAADSPYLFRSFDVYISPAPPASTASELFEDSVGNSSRSCSAKSVTLLKHRHISAAESVIGTDRTVASSGGVPLQWCVPCADNTVRQYLWISDLYADPDNPSVTDKYINLYAIRAFTAGRLESISPVSAVMSSTFESSSSVGVQSEACPPRWDVGTNESTSKIADPKSRCYKHRIDVCTDLARTSGDACHSGPDDPDPKIRITYKGNPALAHQVITAVVSSLTYTGVPTQKHNKPRPRKMHECLADCGIRQML